MSHLSINRSLVERRNTVRVLVATTYEGQITTAAPLGKDKWGMIVAEASYLTVDSKSMPAQANGYVSAARSLRRDAE
jgi:hypothetical protein